MQSEPRRENAVESRGRSTTLDVSEDRRPRLDPRDALDLRGELVSDTAEARAIERVEPLVAVCLVHAEQLEALRDDDQWCTSAIMCTGHELRDVIDGHRHLGDADHVSACGHAGMQRDPADVPAHDLCDHAALVRVAGRAQAVHGVRGDVDRGVEAERVVRRLQVVVDRLGDADDLDPVLRETVGRGECALAADRDDAVDLVPVESLGDVLGSPALALVGVGAAGAQDGAADLRQALHLVSGQRHEVTVDQATPSISDADELQVVRGGALEHDAADDRVEAGAVAAARQDADLHAGAFRRSGDGGKRRRCLRSTLAPRHVRAPFGSDEKRRS